MANIKCIMLFIVYVMAINATEKDRRLVLHSDTDIVTELNKLRTELNDQKTVTQNLNNEMQILTSEIGSLKVVKTKQDLDIQNLTTNVAEKQSEIRNLSITLTSNRAEIQNLSITLTSNRAEIQNLFHALTSKLAEKNAEIQALNSATSTLQSRSTGSSYVRWGKNGCHGNGTSLAYSGFMAGSLRTSTGGTSNYLCLSGQPTWDYYEDGLQDFASIYGVEYEFGGHGASSRTHFFGSDIHNDDAPCAVCHTTRATNIMIPGRNTCYDGWTKEYSGYIVTDHNVLPHGTEYICLDRRPDVVIGGKHNSDESVLYLVEANCGATLECPPYVHGRELACVVCSM